MSSISQVCLLKVVGMARINVNTNYNGLIEIPLVSKFRRSRG